VTVDTITAPAPADDVLVVEIPPTNGPPTWLLFVSLAPAAAVLAFGLIGLFLADQGWYRPVLAFPLGAVACIGVLLIAKPLFAEPRFTRRRPTSGTAHVVAALGIAAILGITAWNAGHASQHVLIDRDGGSYANSGRWIARTGSLEVKPRIGPFADDPTVRFDSLAVYELDNGTLQFQFAHLLPALLAEAYAVGGDAGLFHAPELLGGVALLAFFVLAWRTIRRPWFALAAMLALAFMLPQVSFSRDSYSEIPSQILLFTALWLIVTPRVLPHWRVALVAGLFLGATQATRIDAAVFLLGIPVVLALAWLRAVRAARREVLYAIVAFLVGVVPGFVVGLVDLTRHSGLYWDSLWTNTRQLILATIASFIVCGLVVGLWRFLVPRLCRLPWRVIASAVAIVTALLGFGTWILRARLQQMHGRPQDFMRNLQVAEHIAVDPTRVYFERSMSWMSWYLGPLTVAAAIIGAALLLRALLLGRMIRVAGPLAIIVPGSVLYLWKANAASDHIWVTRRFLVGAFPVLILFAVGLAAYGATTRFGGRWRGTVRGLSIAVAVVAVAYPVYTVWHLRSMSEKRGFLAVIDDACRDLGPHAAVVVVERDTNDLLDDWVPQTLRSWCGADVGVSSSSAVTAQSLHHLADEWNAQGRRFFVVANSTEEVGNLLPDAQVQQTRLVTDPHELEMTLTHRPRQYRTESFAMVVAAVPTS